jgi:hypothetical protein
MRKLTVVLASLLGAAALVAGCSSGSTRLSLSTRAGTAAAAGLGAGQATSRLVAGPNVALTRVRVVIEQIRLDPVSDGGSSSDGGVAGEQLVTGPFLIDLSGAALDAAGLSQVFEVDAQPGDYRRLRFKIHKLDGGATQFPEMAGLSMKLEGTFNGAPFVWTSTLDEEQEREGTFTVTADTANNVTLAVDASGWFSDGAGGAISPIAAQTDGSLRSNVENNIKASIDAFKDDDRNGRR